MKNFMLGLGVALILSVAFAAGHMETRQSGGKFETMAQQYGDFVPDEQVTDDPGYLQMIESHKRHSQSFWNQINSLGTQGWEPVGTTCTVAQYATGKGYTTVVLLKRKLE